ncbi:MAG: hypothetical protein IPL28_19225 [Chloroflexi bacterium]|nr:hypothetical protein [Chloroflexota bacterium]
MQWRKICATTVGLWLFVGVVAQYTAPLGWWGAIVCATHGGLGGARHLRAP